ncbi:MAG: sugar phosphate isomerase/epimerase [Phycisphaerae bacterium]|nr:sugar phosphate isomerase/epimerase [Phycisphaerae bacterium]
MSKINGPAIFLAQFLRDEPPCDSLENITKWVASLGYRGVQIPTWDPRCIDLDKAAESTTYCDELKGTLADAGVAVTELAAHLQGQCVAMHPAYEQAFAGFYPEGMNRDQACAWATDQIIKTIDASANLGLSTVVLFPGALLWPFVYPWPQRPAGIVEEGFSELAKRWKPLLDHAADKGIALAYELHPGEDLHDGATFEMFLEKVDNNPAAAINYDPSHFVLQALDYVAFIKIYGERITAFHVKDAELRPDGRVGVYGGYQGWADRAGRFRSLGDGQVDFSQVFTAMTEIGYRSWAVLEWECCVKSPEQGAAEGAPFIERHLIEAAEVAFDDFAGGDADSAANRKMLGLD